MNKQNHSKIFMQAMAIKNLPYLQAEKSQKIMTLMLTLFLTSVFGIFAISPTLSTIVGLNKQITDSQLVSNSLQTKIKNLNTLHDKFIAISPSLPAVYAALPQDPKSAYLVGQLQQNAKDSGITLHAISVLQVDLKNQSAVAVKSNNFVFLIDAEGTQDTINLFLNDLNQTDRITTIDSLTYTRKINSQNTFELSIRAKAYLKE